MSEGIPEPTLQEWKVQMAEAKIIHLLELYKAKVAKENNDRARTH